MSNFEQANNNPMKEPNNHVDIEGGSIVGEASNLTKSESESSETGVEPITSEQEEAINNIVAKAAEKAVKAAIDHTILNKANAQLVLDNEEELEAIIERATLSALRKLGSDYFVFTETALLQPVATTTVSERDKPFYTKEFFGSSKLSSTIDYKKVGIDEKPILFSPERPYVAMFVKEKISFQDLQKELPKDHFSTLEDIAAMIEAQPEGQEESLLTSRGTTNLFFIKDTNNEVFAVYPTWWVDPVGRGRWRIYFYGKERMAEFDERDDSSKDSSVVGGPGLRVFCPGKAIIDRLNGGDPSKLPGPSLGVNFN